MNYLPTGQRITRLLIPRTVLQQSMRMMWDLTKRIYILQMTYHSWRPSHHRIVIVTKNVFAFLNYVYFSKAKHFIRSGSTEYLGSEFTNSGLTQVLLYTVLDTDPNTGAAWTQDGINALQMGVHYTVKDPLHQPKCRKRSLYMLSNTTPRPTPHQRQAVQSVSAPVRPTNIQAPPRTRTEIMSIICLIGETVSSLTLAG